MCLIMFSLLAHLMKGHMNPPPDVQKHTPRRTSPLWSSNSFLNIFTHYSISLLISNINRC